MLNVLLNINSKYIYVHFQIRLTNKNRFYFYVFLITGESLVYVWWQKCKRNCVPHFEGNYHQFLSRVLQLARQKGKRFYWDIKTDVCNLQ